MYKHKSPEHAALYSYLVWKSAQNWRLWKLPKTVQKKNKVTG